MNVYIIVFINNKKSLCKEWNYSIIPNVGDFICLSLYRHQIKVSRRVFDKDWIRIESFFEENLPEDEKEYLLRENGYTE